MQPLAVKTSGTWEDLPGPAPEGYTVIPQVISSAENTGRDIDGTLHTHRIAVKRTISVAWNLMPSEEFVRLCALTEPDSFRVRYWDPTVGGYLEGDFYRGNDFSYTPAPDPFHDTDGYPRIARTSMTLTER